MGEVMESIEENDESLIGFDPMCGVEAAIFVLGKKTKNQFKLEC